LWASTSTKNPAYRDTLYVEELIGPQTVNTLPPATVDAFRDHGVAAAKIEAGDYASDLAALAKAGINLAAVTQQLENEGVELFSDSFRQLLSHLEEKRGKLAASR
jgi:transaldolase